MNKAFEKILERLEAKREYYYLNDGIYDTVAIEAMDFAIDEVRKAAEEFGTDTNVGTNGWIPCSEMLPEDGVPVLLQDSEGYYSLGVSETKRNIKGFRDCDWWESANNYKAWHQLPEPYKEKE